MRSILRRRPSPAFVLASLALLVALGGTGVAAVEATVPNNSVGPAQLRTNAVTSPKIATSAVTSAKLAANAVTSAKIAAGAVTGAKIANAAVTGTKIANNAITSAQVQSFSLLASDFAPGQIPAGPQGPAGPAGPQGPPGLSGVQIVSASTETGDAGVKFTTVSCPAGKKVLGGGAQATGDAVTDPFTFITIRESNPVPAGTGWHALAGNLGNGPTTPNTWQLTVWAVCASAT